MNEIRSFFFLAAIAAACALVIRVLWCVARACRPRFGLSPLHAMPEVALAGKLHQQIQKQLAVGDYGPLFSSNSAAFPASQSVEEHVKQVAAKQLGVPPQNVHVFPLGAFQFAGTGVPTIASTPPCVWKPHDFRPPRVRVIPDCPASPPNLQSLIPNPFLGVTILDPPQRLPTAIAPRCRCLRCAAFWNSSFGRDWLPVESPLPALDPRAGGPVYSVPALDAAGQAMTLRISASAVRLRIGVLEIEP